MRQRESLLSRLRDLPLSLGHYPDFVPRNKREGWEDRLQHQFEDMAREEFGIEIDDKVFLG